MLTLVGELRASLLPPIVSSFLTLGDVMRLFIGDLVGLYVEPIVLPRFIGLTPVLRPGEFSGE